MTPEFVLSIAIAAVGMVVGYWLKPVELKYTVWSVAGTILTMGIPGGRVLVLPMIFVVLLVLMYWAAKPRSEV